MIRQQQVIKPVLIYWMYRRNVRPMLYCCECELSIEFTNVKEIKKHTQPHGNHTLHCERCGVGYEPTEDDLLRHEVLHRGIVSKQLKIFEKTDLKVFA